MISTMRALIEDLLVAARRPDAFGRDVDLVLRAEAFLQRLEAADHGQVDDWLIEPSHTYKLPALLDQGWRLFYEVSRRPSGELDPMIFGMVRRGIRILRNEAQKTILIPRASLQNQRTTRKQSAES